MFGAFGHFKVLFSVDKSISFHERLGFSTLAHLNKEMTRLRIIQDTMAKYKVSCFALRSHADEGIEAVGFAKNQDCIWMKTRWQTPRLGNG
jgi:hypothetical protein